MPIKAIYEKLNKTSFYICLVFSIILIAVSFVVPPTGIVDGSVLAAVGEVFAFATLGTVIHAIMKGADVTLNHGNTSVTLNTPDDKEE